MNRFIQIAFFGILASTTVCAVDYPANYCEVFIKTVGAAPGSHGMESMVAVVKVGGIGHGEQVQRVRFYGTVTPKDLGNASACRSTPAYRSDWKEYIANVGTDFERGEYIFSFQIKTGSVVNACPGYEFSWMGAFFVETDKNTYWLNPDMNPRQHFYFDKKGYDMVLNKGGRSWDGAGGLPTTRDDLSHYNPRRCE